MWASARTVLWAVALLVIVLLVIVALVLAGYGRGSTRHGSGLARPHTIPPTLGGGESGAAAGVWRKHKTWDSLLDDKEAYKVYIEHANHIYSGIGQVDWRPIEEELQGVLGESRERLVAVSPPVGWKVGDPLELEIHGRAWGEGMSVSAELLNEPCFMVIHTHPKSVIPGPDDRISYHNLLGAYPSTGDWTIAIEQAAKGHQAVYGLVTRYGLVAYGPSGHLIARILDADKPRLAMLVAMRSVAESIRAYEKLNRVITLDETADFYKRLGLVFMVIPTREFSLSKWSSWSSNMETILDKVSLGEDDLIKRINDAIADDTNSPG